MAVVVPPVSFFVVSHEFGRIDAVPLFATKGGHFFNRRRDEVPDVLLSLPFREQFIYAVVLDNERKVILDRPVNQVCREVCGVLGEFVQVGEDGTGTFVLPLRRGYKLRPRFQKRIVLQK